MNYGDVYSYRIDVTADARQGEAITQTVRKFASATDVATESTQRSTRAGERARDELGRFTKRVEASAAGLKEYTVAAERAEAATASAGNTAGMAGNAMARMGGTIMAFSQLADDAAFGAYALQNNVGMLVSAMGGFTPMALAAGGAAQLLVGVFKDEINVGLEWAGILNENVAKGLGKATEATDAHSESVAALTERLEAAGEATRKLDDAEKERRANIQKALEQQSNAQQGVTGDAQAVMQQLGGKRFAEFVQALATRDVAGNMDPNSPFGRGEVSRRSNAILGGVAGGDSGQSALMLALMQRNPAVLQRFGVAMPPPRAIGADAGQQTEAARLKAAEEAEREKIRQQIAEEDRKKEEDRKRAEDDARKRAAAARKAEEDRLAGLYGGGTGSALEDAALNRLAAGQSPDQIGADLMMQAEQTGLAPADAFALVAEALKEAQEKRAAETRAAAVGLADMIRQQQEDDARAFQQMMQEFAGVSYGARQSLLQMWEAQRRQMNATAPRRTNRPFGP